MSRLAGKYAGILMTHRGFTKPQGNILTNKEKYSFNSNVYSISNLISIEDEDPGFESETTSGTESPPPTEMNLEWGSDNFVNRTSGGWGQNTSRSTTPENSGWSNLGNNRAKSKSESSDRSGSHDRLNSIQNEFS